MTFRSLLPALVLVVAFNAAVTIIGITIAIVYVNQQQDDIRNTAAVAHRLAQTQAKLQANQEDQLRTGCVRGELGRQEQNRRADIERNLWLAAAQARLATARASTDPEQAHIDRTAARFYQAQIARMQDVPVLIPHGWKLATAELHARSVVVCKEAYP